MMLETLFIRSREQGAASLTTQEQVKGSLVSWLCSYWLPMQLDVIAQPTNPETLCCTA